MRAARTFALFALLPLFAACQMFESEPAKPSTAGLTRMQGELTAVGGKLLFQPCNDNRHYVLNDTGGTSVLQDAALDRAAAVPPEKEHNAEIYAHTGLT